MIYTHNSGELFYTPDAIAEIHDMYENHSLRERLLWLHSHFSTQSNFSEIKTTLESSKIPNKEIGIANFFNTRPHAFDPALEAMRCDSQKVEFYVSCYNNGTDILAHLTKDDIWLPIESKTTGAKLVSHYGARAPARGKNYAENRAVEYGSDIKLHSTDAKGTKDQLVERILQKYFHDCALFFTHYRGVETDFNEVYPDIIFLDRDTFNDIIMLYHKLDAGEKCLAWDGRTISLSISSFYNKFSDRCTVLQTLHP